MAGIPAGMARGMSQGIEGLDWLGAVHPDGGGWDLLALEQAAPQLLTRGPDGEAWGVDAERVTGALAVATRTLLAQLELERRRSTLLDRRTRWLYKAVTGYELPEDEQQEGPRG